MTPIKDMGEADKIFFFRHGLRLDIAREVKKPKSLSDAMDQAVRAEGGIVLDRSHNNASSLLLNDREPVVRPTRLETMEQHQWISITSSMKWKKSKASIPKRLLNQRRLPATRLKAMGPILKCWPSFKRCVQRTSSCSPCSSLVIAQGNAKHRLPSHEYQMYQQRRFVVVVRRACASSARSQAISLEIASMLDRRCV